MGISPVMIWLSVTIIDSALEWMYELSLIMKYVKML